MERTKPLNLISSIIYAKNSNNIDTPIKVDSNGYIQATIISNTVNFSRKETSQNLALGTLSYISNFNVNVKIKQVLIHSSVAITETITIYFNSVTGSNYDTQLISETLVAESNLVYRPGELILLQGDELTITCTNSGGTGIVYVTIIGELI